MSKQNIGATGNRGRETVGVGCRRCHVGACRNEGSCWEQGQCVGCVTSVRRNTFAFCFRVLVSCALSTRRTARIATFFLIVPEFDSLLRYPLTVSLELVSIAGSSHVYKTLFLASLQIQDLAILPASVLRYCSCLLLFHRWLTHYSHLPYTLFSTTLLFLSCTR